MDYREYRSRIAGAGPKRFFLVKYWERSRMKIRELNKGPSAETPIEEFHYPVRDVDPTKHGTADAEGDEADWEWDDQVGRMPISRSRARPQNREEMIWADTLRDRRQQELREISDDTPAGVRVKSDIRFLKAVKAEFRLWFMQSDFEVPVDSNTDGPQLSGHKYARELYDYLELSSTSPDEIGYKYLTKVYEAVSEDRPAAFMVSYNGFHKALKKAELYPTQASNRSNREKLMVLLRRIKDFVEEGERPV